MDEKTKEKIVIGGIAGAVGAGLIVSLVRDLSNPYDVTNKLYSCNNPTFYHAFLGGVTLRPGDEWRREITFPKGRIFFCFLMCEDTASVGANSVLTYLVDDNYLTKATIGGGDLALASYCEHLTERTVGGAHQSFGLRNTGENIINIREIYLRVAIYEDSV